MLKRLMILVAIVWVWVGGIARASGYPWHELYGPANIPNWLLALVGIGAVIAALKTLWAIRKQADIQAAGMQQWVDVESRSVEDIARLDGSFEIRLQFEAVNNTPYLLTIQKIITEISYYAGDFEKFTVSYIKRLPPSRNGKVAGYSFFVGTRKIPKVNFEQGATLTINGWVTFEDCLEKIHTEWFGGLYDCKPGQFKYIPIVGIVPDKETKSDHT